MIYWDLFCSFLMIGAVSLGGGYGMLSLIRETVLNRGWLAEEELINFIAVSESTPGPLAVNMATFIGASQGGFWGAAVATVGAAGVYADSSDCGGHEKSSSLCRRSGLSERTAALCSRHGAGNGPADGPEAAAGARAVGRSAGAGLAGLAHHSHLRNRTIDFAAAGPRVVAGRLDSSIRRPRALLILENRTAGHPKQG